MFSMTMKTGTAAFCDEKTGKFSDACEGFEICRILMTVEDQIRTGKRRGNAIDLNGNKVGEWKID